MKGARCTRVPEAIPESASHFSQLPPAPGRGLTGTHFKLRQESEHRGIMPFRQPLLDDPREHRGITHVLILQMSAATPEYPIVSMESPHGDRGVDSSRNETSHRGHLHGQSRILRQFQVLVKQACLVEETALDHQSIQVKMPNSPNRPKSQRDPRARRAVEVW